MFQLFEMNLYAKSIEKMLKIFWYWGCVWNETNSWKFIRQSERNIWEFRKSAMYKIILGWLQRKLYDQSRRTVKTRYIEHSTHIKYSISEK